MISVSGFIGELNDVVPPLLEPLKFVADKLITVAAYVPSLSTTALLAYAEAFQAYQLASSVATSVVSAWNTVSGAADGANQTKQQKAFQKFYGYWRNRTLFTIQTPWAIFQDCAIKSLRAVQEAETRMVSNFEITFKQMRFASSVTVRTIVGVDFQGRSASQAAGLVDLGSSTPVPGTAFPVLG